MDQVQQQAGPGKPRTLVEIDGDFLKAQDERDAFLTTNKPSPFEKEAFEDYKKRLDTLDKAVSDKQKELVSGLRAAAPEDIEGYQQHLDTRQQNEQAKEQGQGQQQDSEQPQSSLRDMLEQRRGNSWSPSQGQDGEAQDEQRQTQQQAQHQGQSRQQVGRGYADYARGAQDEHDKQQSMEEMEREYRAHNLGAGSVTVGEIEDWHSQRNAQQQGAGQQNSNSQDKSERDWNDQVLGTAKHAPQMDEPQKQKTARHEEDPEHYRYRPQAQ